MQPNGNIHASCVVLGDRGLLVTGPSSSGKTTLALTLIDQFRAAGRFARLAADDQVFLRTCAGRLIGKAPDTIAGMAEAHGLGPRPVEAEAEAVIDFIAELVPAESAPRFQEETSRLLADCELPLLLLPQRNVLGAALAISAWLSRPPFL
jgi:serine kinase of HPr protein (carbohydrate metabolism regulator)